MSKHTEASPLAGKTVKIREGAKHPQVPGFAGSEYRVEDWWDRLDGRSWMDCTGNPACLVYAFRSAGATPIDDEVLYGKIGPLGHLVHISEIDKAEWYSVCDEGGTMNPLTVSQTPAPTERKAPLPRQMVGAGAATMTREADMRTSDITIEVGDFKSQSIHGGICDGAQTMGVLVVARDSATGLELARELVDATRTVWEPATTNKIGRLGAYRDLAPSDERVAAAEDRCSSAASLMAQADEPW